MAPAIDEPILPPIELQRDKTAMAIPRSLCLTEAWAATVDPMIDHELPTVMRNLPKKRQAVLVWPRLE